MNSTPDPATAPPEPPDDLPRQVEAALREDLGPAGTDLTAQLVPLTGQVRGRIVTRAPAVLCGRPWVDETFRRLDPDIRLTWLAREGAAVRADDVLVEIRGRARPVLTGERTALNFLQLLSGTATAARAYVEAVAGTGCVILDTRKTLPGLRSAQKYAVRCGGARNHRMGLYDMVLIKENHIAAAGSITAAIAAARRIAGSARIEVEVEDLGEFREALAARPDVILLDELDDADLRAAVALNRAAGSPVHLEASGGVSLESVRTLAATGVDYVSIGSITKHVKAIDLSMRLDPESKR